MQQTEKDLNERTLLEAIEEIRAQAGKIALNPVLEGAIGGCNLTGCPVVVVENYESQQWQLATDKDGKPAILYVSREIFNAHRQPG